MIKAARFASDDDRRRFQNEAEAVARLDHPNIVPIFEVGQFEDQHYFSMKLIGGESLDKGLKDYTAHPSRAARLVAVVAGAVHHAHQRGILHRDLKPANILIDAEGQPHVTDFGLAKRVEGDSELTQSGAILGTPAYMAPEQASGRRGAVTTSTDVHGLGMILFALFTGRAPFGGTTVLDTLEQVRERPPDSPRKLNPRVPRDLEVICLRCLEKDPRRRYASADALAEDLKRWLAGEPIAARPVGNAARVWMWCRRNPIIAAAAGLVAASLLVVVVLSLLYAGQQTRLAEAKTRYADEQRRRGSEQAEATTKITGLNKNLEKERQDLKTALADSNRRLAMVHFERAQRSFDSNQINIGLLWLVETWRYAAKADDLAWQHLARANLSFWRLQCPDPKGVFFHRTVVSGVAFSPDGRTILTWSAFGTPPRLWNAATGLPIGNPLEHEGVVYTAAFSPDGKTILTAGQRGAGLQRQNEARLWDAATGKPIGKPLYRRGGVAFRGFTPAAFSPSGKTILTAGQRESGYQGPNEAHLWDAATWQPIGRPLVHQAQIRSVAFSPDGKTIVTVDMSNMARLWDAATTQPVGQPMTHQAEIVAVAFAPNGKTVLTGSHDKTARLWDALTAEPIGLPMAHQGEVSSVAFSPDGETVLTGSSDRTARLWDALTVQPIGMPMTHQGEVTSVAFSPDGETVLTGSLDKTARLWDAATTQPVGQPMTHRGEVASVAYSPDGKTVLTGSYDQTARLWDANNGRLIGRPIDHQGEAASVSFSPDGRAVLTGGSPAARLWHASSGRPMGLPMVYRGASGSMAFRPDGKTILTGSYYNRAQLWDAATSQPIGQPLVHQAPVDSVAFSPDGKTVVTGSDQTARLWDVASSQPIGKPMVHQEGMGLLSVAFSPDGKTTLTTSLNDNTARLWVAATGSPAGQPMAHESRVIFAAFSPDGKTILTGSGGTARLWDAATGRPLGQPVVHQLQFAPRAFSADGKTFLSVGDKIRLWDIASGHPIGQPIVGGSGAKSVALSPDGKTIVASHEDSKVRLWDAATGQPIGPPLDQEGLAFCVGFSPDGRTIVSASYNFRTRRNALGPEYTARLWHLPALVDDDLPRIKVWVEAVTGLGVNDYGTIGALDSEIWQVRRRRLEQLGGLAKTDSGCFIDPVINGFDPTARARALMERQRWTEAEAAYAEAVQALPLSGAVRLERGRFYITRCDPERAAANFREFVRLQPADFQTRRFEMLTLLAAGDHDGFGRAGSNLLDQFRQAADHTKAKSIYAAKKKTEDAITADSVAWSLAMAPCAVADKSVSVRLAEIAVKDSFRAQKHSALGTLGAALYRAGQFEDAIQRLNDGIQLRDGTTTPRDSVFLAMSHHRLGHRDAARRWLDRLRNRQPSTDPNQFWDELEIRLLRSEAEAVILYDPIFPANPFAR
ncbi:MAG: protein kinase [Isosphaerales bacterium]